MTDSGYAQFLNASRMYRLRFDLVTLGKFRNPPRGNHPALEITDRKAMIGMHINESGCLLSLLSCKLEVCQH